MVNTNEIVGVFDLDNASTSRITRQYLAIAQKSGNIVEVSSDIPKSFVVCEYKGEVKIYLSQISSSTLRKRSDYIKEISRHKPD